MLGIFPTVSEVSVDRMDEMSMHDYCFDASPLSCGASSSPYSFHGDSSAPAVFERGSTSDGVPQKLAAGPWLLGKESGPSPMVVVKNTFINGYVQEDEDEDDGLPVFAARSCPVVKMPIPQSDAAVERSPCFGAAVFARFREEEPRSLTVQYLDGDNKSADGSPAYILPRELAERFRCDSRRGSPTAPSAQNIAAATDLQASGLALEPWVKPLHLREPEVSLGSIPHGSASGECRPCAWFWRPQGCSNAAECRHCHLCPQGEVKARRKSKISSMRQQGRVDRAACTAASPKESEAGRRQLELTMLV